MPECRKKYAIPQNFLLHLKMRKISYELKALCYKWKKPQFIFDIQI